MRKIGIVLFVLALMSSCDLFENQMYIEVTDGCYHGYFRYNNQNYWSSICFENGKYVEWPSGGAMYQKSYSCITVGTYSTEDNKLEFLFGSYKMKDFPENCNADLLLPGKYKIKNSGKQDSLIFTRGSGDELIVYHLKRYVAENN